MSETTPEKFNAGEQKQLTQDKDYILEMTNITKTFLNGKIIANDDISISFERNKIHTIIGENGSGKSTLMSILFGLYKQDSGKIRLNGKRVDMYTAGASKKYKIGMVHQHFHLVDDFTILENILIGQEEDFSSFGFINKSKAKEKLQNLITQYNFNLEPNKKVGKLNVGQKQKVEILKVLWKEKSIIVFDEPTATLSVKEIEDLLQIIVALKESGKTIIFISHKLQEVKQISDNISILSKGKLKGTFVNKDLSKDDIANLMFDDVKETSINKEAHSINQNKIALKVEDLVYDTSSGFRALNGVSFDIYEGEIFGLAGIEGNGQEEIINTIAGIKKPKSGKIEVFNKSIMKWNIKKRNEIMSHIPIDRIKYGLAPNLSIEFNSIISDLRNPKFARLNLFNRNLILNSNVIEQHTQNIIARMNVDGANDVTNEIRNLSGGNQQKFVVGRELEKSHELLLAGHPTRGLDIKAINNIYQNIIDNSQNKGTLLYSLEISELINVCDRIAILYKGKIVDIIDPIKTTFEEISNLMIGVKND